MIKKNQNSMKKKDLIREVDQLRNRVIELEEWCIERDNLNQKNSLLASIVESSNDAIIGLTVSGVVMSWNKGAEKIYGYTSMEAFGCKASVFAPPEGHHEILDIQEKTMSGLRISYFETVHLKKDGTTFPVVLSVSPILNSKGEVVGMSLISRDITRQKQMETNLRQSEEKYRSIFENIVVGIFQTTPEGRHLSVNPAYLRMFGYSSGEELRTEASSIEKLYSNKDDIKSLKTLLDSQGVVEGFELEGVKKDKTRIWVSLSVRASKDAYGAALLFDGIVEDITRRKQAEKSFVLEKKISDLIIDSLPGVFYLFDDEQNYIRWNKDFERVSGYSGREVHRMDPLDFIKSEDKEAVREAIRECLEKGDATLEAQLLTKDGRTIPHVFTGRRIIINNRPYLVGMGIDITERKNAEERLQMVQSQQKALLDNNPDIAWLKDKEGRFIAVNEPFSKACGVKRGDLVGKTDLDIWPAVLAESYRIDDQKVIETGEQKRVEEPLADSNGIIKWIETIKTPVWDGQGNIAGTTGIARDITDRKKAEDELRASSERLRKSFSGTIKVISKMLETRDPYTAGHQRRVSRLARSIAQKMELPGDVIDAIRMAGSIHDIGKISIPAGILSRPSGLSDT
jgi:PAS domain S-box-containing protein